MNQLKFYRSKFVKVLQVVILFLMLQTSEKAYATLKTSNVVTGNWSSAASWTPSGVPASTDNVVIKGGNTITVDGVYTCSGLDIGDVTLAAATLNITLAANSLTITGDLRINPSNKAYAFVLDAGPGAINVNGTFSTWGTLGTNTIKVAAGSITFTPAVAITNTTQTITFYGAGTVNFNGTFADSYNKLVTFASCVVNFASTYTVSTTVASWAAKGTANFTGTSCAIIANANLTMYNVQVNTSQTLTINNVTGNTIIGGAFTLNSGSTLTLNKNIEMDGNWVNNGGTLSGGTNTIMFNGTAQTIGGTSSTSFPTLQIGNTAIPAIVACTMNNSNTCSYLVFAGTTKAGTLTLGSAAVTLTVTNDLTNNQPTAAATNNLAINAGACTVGGNLYFTGTTSTATFISKITVTTGSFNLTGSVTWMSNTLVATEVITVSTGILTFGSPLTMGTGSGTLTATGAATINFNGNFNFGGAVTSPVFTVVAGTILNFKNGFTNNTTALTLIVTSIANFTGNGAITANANITFGITNFNTQDTINASSGNVAVAGALTLASGSSLTLNRNLEVDANFVNNGGTLNGGSNTVTFNGAAAQAISGSATTFPTLQIGNTAAANTVAVTMSISNTCSYLVFAATTKAGTLTLGSSAVALTITHDLTINQPASSVINSLTINAGSCTVGGNLYFTGATNTATWISKIIVTTGSFSLTGAVTWMGGTAAATQIITVSTGALTFGSALTMGTGSGTLSASGAATINFNGNFNFGGPTLSPSFTVVASTILNFKNGFTNNTTALTLISTSIENFTGNGSITANANITLGITNIKAQDTIGASTGNVAIAGLFTLASGSSLAMNRNFEVDGSWINSGGTLSGGSNTVVFNGAVAQTISGSATTFPTLQIGNTVLPNAVAITASCNTTCSYLVFAATTKAGTLTLSSSSVALTVFHDLTIDQPAAAITNSLVINAGTCTVGGNLYFTGATNTATWVSKITVTTGSFSLTGAVNWMGTTAAATQVITVSTGTLTFGSPLTMGTGSGTISLSGAATINFNGTFSFGGATLIPVFTSFANCNLNFKKGFTNNTAALTLVATSNSNFTGNGSITANANITFGNTTFSGTDTIANVTGNTIVAGILTLASGSTLTMNKNFEVDGNWVNNGGTLNGGSNTIIFNGTAQTISGNPTSFPTLQIGNAAIAATVACTMSNSNTCSYLVFAATSKAGTLTLGSSTVVLTVTNDMTINQPAAAVTNNLAVNTGACTVGGNLYFTGTGNTTTWISKITVTSGSFALTGTVTWMSNTAVATEVITVTTGTLTFNNSLTMGTGSGTLTITGGGTINFNGTTAPSFNFGGAATSPVFTNAVNSTLNFKNGFTNTTTALTLAYPSTATFTGSGSVTPSAAIAFSTININSGATLTLAGSISLKGNWNDLGSFTPGVNTVTFNPASPNTQTITKTGGETFYNLTATTAGATLILANNITITNTLTMSGMGINLNNNTLTLGNNAAATLTYTAGIAYGGTWTRWIPVAVISSTVSPFYGLFPIGTSTDYRPLAINSTANPTGAGYISATNSNSSSIALVSYTDNESASIQVVSLETSTFSNAGVIGGTYSLYATYTALNSTGVATDLKLETYTSNTMGSAGTTAATTGTVMNPTVKRTGLTAAQLSNTFVVGSKNVNNTPLGQFYYSRKTGNWDDVSANGTWSTTPGGVACSCLPTSNSNVYINAGDTVTSNMTGGSADYVYIYSGAMLADNGLIPLTINKDMNVYGTGQFSQKGTWTISRAVNLSSTSSCSSTGTITVGGALTIPSGATFTVSSGSLTLNSDVALSGNIALGASTQLNLSGSGANLSGSGTISGAASSTVTVNGDKTISTGSTIVIGSAAIPNAFNINGAANINNNGSIKVYGDLTGTSASSNWVNNPNSTLEVTGNLLSTGIIDASASPNIVTYSANGSQTIKAPVSSYYDLFIANGGTKTLSGSTVITDALKLQDSVVLDESTYLISGGTDLNMTGKSELRMQRSISGTYPELSGDYSLTGGTITINQTAGTASIASNAYYNLKFTGSSSYDLSAITSVNKDISVQNASTIISSSPVTVAGMLNYSSSATSTLSSTMTIGGLALSAGGLNDGGGNIIVNGSGGWSVTGGTFTSTGTETFTGGLAQSISGSVAGNFNNLVLNNAGGVTLNVSPAAPTVISNLLTLTNGIIHTNGSNAIRILNNAGATSGSAASYIDGPMVKVGNDDFVFPIGNGGKWMRAAIAGITDSLTEVTGQYFATPYSTLNAVSGKITNVSTREYWTIERTVGSDSMTVQLFWQDASKSTLLACSNITIAHFTSSHWIQEPATIVSGSACGGHNAGSMITNARVTSFSPFTYGSTGAVLPIKLMSFTAEKTDNDADALLKWSTAAEENNDHFDVEEATDINNNGSDGQLVFNKIGEVKGAGTSVVESDYSLVDTEANKSGTRYYRLKQVDFDGNFTYSDIIALQFNGIATTVNPLELSHVYPNPVADMLHLKITSLDNRTVTLTITNLIGQEIFNEARDLTEGINGMDMDVSRLHNGIFFLSVIDGTTRYAPQKFEKF